MKKETIKSILNEMPRLVQKLIKRAGRFLPKRFVFGGDYLSAREFLEESQWWSTDRLIEYRRGKLNNLMKHAYKNVPYYREIFEKRGLKPNDIESKEDLKKLPYLTKEKVRNNFDKLKAKNIREGERTVSQTSGSTGQPFQFEESRHIIDTERAFINRAFRAHDTDVYHEKTVWLRSYSPDSGEPIYRHDPHIARLCLSPFHISRERIPEYARLINSYGAETLIGYPSSIYIFATLLEKTDQDLEHVRKVHTGSEQLLTEWRDRIESVLGVPVYDHYGMVEKVGLFHQCPESSAYHENLEYGIVEIDNPEDGTGEIVGTSLLNYAMPLIRYRMGDRATLNRGSTSCACGRGLPLTIESFEGRADDLLHTPDGRILPGVNFYTLMYSVDGIDMFKIEQSEVDRVNVQIMAGEEFGSDQHRHLTNGLRNRLGDEVDIQVSIVDTIERDESTGKISCIESSVGE